MLLSCALLLTAGCGKKQQEANTPNETSAGDAAMTDTTSGENSQTTPAASKTENDGGTEDSSGTETAAETATNANGETAAPAPVSTAANDEVGEGQTAPLEGADNDQEGEYGTPPAQEKTTAADTTSSAKHESTPGGNHDGKLQITVETVEITVDELKAQDYTVPVLVTIDKNPGITYSEWGLKLDERCTYTADSEGLDFSTVYYINDARHFLWTAWTSGAELKTKTGSLLQVNVKLPMDAQPGTTYTLAYADWSLADAAHIWQSPDQDWVKANEIGWVDGGVVVK